MNTWEGRWERSIWKRDRKDAEEEGNGRTGSCGQVWGLCTAQGGLAGCWVWGELILLLLLGLGGKPEESSWEKRQTAEKPPVFLDDGISLKFVGYAIPTPESMLDRRNHASTTSFFSLEAILSSAISNEDGSFASRGFKREFLHTEECGCLSLHKHTTSPEHILYRLPRPQKDKGFSYHRCLLWLVSPHNWPG